MMQEAATVRLVAPTAELRPALLSLAPRDGLERDWVGDGATMLPAAEGDPTRHPVAIVARGRAVGMLTLDWGARSRRYAAADEIGLHGLLIDPRHRRQGYALAALQALPVFVRRAFPLTTAIALTVNEQNLPGIVLYRAAGFVDRGERFLGGTAGPQHVLRLELRAASGGVTPAPSAWNP